MPFASLNLCSGKESKTVEASKEKEELSDLQRLVFELVFSELRT
jgi:hypothetical protein